MKKKSTRMKLLSAAAMLGISAAMLATSTYAWFTLNKTVSVEGINLYARAEGGIVIGRVDKTRASGVVNEDAGLTDATHYTLFPTSTANTTSWFHATAETSDAHTAKNGTLETINLASSTAPTASAPGIMSVDGKDFVLYDTYTVWPDTNSTQYTDLFISYCEASASNDLSKSVRVAFVAEGGNTVICAPMRAADDTHLTYTVGESSTEVTALGTSGTKSTPLTKTDANTLVSGEVGTSGKALSVYVYYEGEDNDHFTNNLTGNEDIAIEFGLSCSTVTGV